MALINTSVPNLIQGVSQQPDAARFDGQCEEQENALSAVAEGLKKRPKSKRPKSLSSFNLIHCVFNIQSWISYETTITKSSRSIFCASIRNSAVMMLY